MILRSLAAHIVTYVLVGDLTVSIIIHTVFTNFVLLSQVTLPLPPLQCDDDVSKSITAAYTWLANNMLEWTIMSRMWEKPSEFRGPKVISLTPY